MASSSLRSKAVLPLLLGLLIISLTTVPAEAGIGGWTRHGPHIRDVRAVAVDPTHSEIVFAGSLGGLYRSTDGGDSWHRVLGEDDQRVGLVVIDPATPSRIFGQLSVGPYRNILYVSHDGGDSWEYLSERSSQKIFDLAIDPSRPQTLWAAFSDDLECGYCGMGSLEKSTDGGYAWTVVSGLQSPPDYLSVELDPLDPTTIYVTNRWQVLESTDGGTTWIDITPAEAPDGSPLTNFAALMIDPRDPARLYLGTSKGIFKSFDGGGSWFFSSQSPIDITALAIDPDDPDHLFAAGPHGLSHSMDGGSTWSVARPQAGSTNAHGITLAASDPSHIWACSRGDGLVHSLDGGTSWQIVPVGMEIEANVEALTFTNTVDPMLYIGVEDGGVFRSADGGRSWQRMNRGLLEGTVLSIFVDPAEPGHLWVGTETGIFTTNDGGRFWRPVDTRQSRAEKVVDLAAPNDGHLYALTKGGTLLCGQFDSNTWSRCLCGDGSCHVQDLYAPYGSHLIYAAVGQSVMRSTNHGMSWQTHTQGLPDAPVLSLGGEVTTPWIVFAGTGDGVYKSTYWGETWFPSGNGLCLGDACAVIEEIAVYGPMVWARSWGDFYRSADGGDHWTILGGADRPRGHGLAIHPWSPSTVYVGSYDHGAHHRLEVDCLAATGTCHGDGRFFTELTWRDFQGRKGIGRAQAFSNDDSAVFWFFEPQNWEMLAKIIDGTAFDGHHWVFAGIATNVGYELRITDLLAGRARRYRNPRGQTAATLAEIGVFPAQPVQAVPGPVSEELVWLTPAPPPDEVRIFDPADVGAPCQPSPTILCLLDGRFRVVLDWRDFSQRTGQAHLAPFGSDDSGLWWFFDPDNWEMLVKMVDGCQDSDRFWLFASATTNVEHILRVTDTVTGYTLRYINPLGRPAATIATNQAFDCTPP